MHLSLHAVRLNKIASLHCSYKSFGNNNGPSNQNQLPIIPPKKEVIVENNPNRQVQPSPKPAVSAVQQRILDAQARAKEQNASSPPVSKLSKCFTNSK